MTITLKAGKQLVQPKAPSLVCHLQESEIKEIQQLQQQRRKKLQKKPKITLISPAVLTIEEDKTV